MSGVCWLVLRDGRNEYHKASLESARWALPQPAEVVFVDDPEHLLGFGGAIEEGWRRVLATGCSYVFHLEADFTFNERVPLPDLIWLLQRHPRLAQVALKRQAWNNAEKMAGGIVELYPDDFEERHDNGRAWTAHRRFFTTNPSVYPIELCRRGWPTCDQSEGIFTHRLLEDGFHFGFWGRKFDRPLVEHIGVERRGRGY